MNDSDGKAGQDPPSPVIHQGRRRALKVVVGATGAAIAATAAPGLGYILDPLLRRTTHIADFIAVADETALREDRPVMLPVIGEKRDAWTRARRVELGSVWVRRNEGGDLSCLSAECPHLGCKIAYAETNEKYTCPCHASFFELDGSVTEGPSPRAMDPLEVKVEDGKILVQFKRFRTGVEDQVEIG
jgi:menaquinol-cytochrome c reductase iron-sulfur subunit